MTFMTREERQKLHKNATGSRLAPKDIFSASEMYVCQYSWPDDCFVQCGDQDMDRKKFFESFPRNPNTYLRGSSDVSIEEAEVKCWKQYQKICGCPLDHTDPDNFDPHDYTNGYAFCKSCGMGASKIIPPTDPCINCGEKTFYSHDNKGQRWCEKCYDSQPKELWTDIRKGFEPVRRELKELEKKEAAEAEELVKNGIKDVFNHILGKSV